MNDVTVVMVVYDLWAWQLRNRKHHFAQFLAGQPWVREVVFCEPPLPEWVIRPGGAERLRGMDRAACGGFRDRCERLLTGERVAGGLLLRVAPRLAVFAPLGDGPPDATAPLVECYRAQDRERLVESLRDLPAVTNAKDLLLWMHSPFVPEVIDALPWRWLVYDCTDDYAAFPWPDAGLSDVLRSNDECITRQATLVLAVAAHLLQEKSRHSERVERLPNGCEVEHFLQACGPPLATPDEFCSIPPPVIGYFGRANTPHKIDYPLLLFLAARHPDWQFVFVGLSPPPWEGLALPNLHFLGRRSYAQLPAYAAQFDVCIVPHCVSRMTESMDPIKLYEYLATGMPVVSTRVAGPSELEPEVTVADTWEAFETAVADALRHGRLWNREGRLERALSCTWERRFAALQDCLDRHCFSQEAPECAASVCR